MSFPITIDDMFISLRYANHWVLGQGLVWNVGEQPVEGYSNFSFVVLASLAFLFKIDPVFVLKMTGVLGLLLTLIALYLLSRFWFQSRLAFIPLLWLLSYYGQIIWTASGLETTIYQALISFSLFFLFRGMGYRFYPKTREEPSFTTFIISGLLLALASLTRPEAPILAVLFFMLVLFDKSASRKKNYKGLAYAILSFSAIFIPYFLWRIYYFGAILPNSVACKGFNGYSFAVDKNYLILSWPFLFLSGFALVKLKDRRILFLLLPSVLYLILLIGADTVSVFANRLFLPAFLLLLPSTLLGIKFLLDAYLKSEDTISLYCLWIIAFVFAFFFIPLASLDCYKKISKNPIAGNQLRIEVLSWLKNNARPNSYVLLGDSGMIPYLSKLNFIDSYCLNNKAMTRPPKKDIYNRLCHDIFDIKPDIIILTSLIEKGQVIYMPTDLCLQQKLSKQHQYHFRKLYQTKDLDSQYRYEVYSLKY